MRYSNAGEIIVIMVAWAAVLLVVKSVLDKPAVQHVQAAFTRPQVEMVMRHVGCSEQYQEVVQALKALPWVGETRVERGADVAHTAGTSPQATPAPHAVSTVRPEQPLEPCGVRVLAEVKNVEQAEFMQLTATLRDIGVVPLTIEFGGLPSFALQAHMVDMSCTTCEQAALEALKPFPVSATYYYSTTPNPVEVSKQRTFQWLDSKSVDTTQNTITVVVLPQHTARIGEMLRSFERAGLLPLALRIVVDKA
jgi:hypothetical protein